MRSRLLRLVAPLAVLSCLVATVPGSVARADSVTDRKHAIDRQIAQLRDELEGTSQEFANAAVQLQRSQAMLVDVRAQLVTARREVSVAQQRDAQIASRLDYAQAQEAKAARELDGQREAQRKTRAAIGLIARQTYVNSGLTGVTLALQADSPDQFADRLSFASAALQSQSSVIERLSEQEADLRARSAKLSAIRVQVDALKRESEAAVRARKAAEATAGAAEAQQAALVAQQAAALAVIKARAAQEQARLDAAQAEQSKLQAMLAARARAEAARHRGSAPPPAASPGVLGYPANGPITSGFGRRYHPILHIWRMHTGTDFGIACGTPVYAAAAGTMISAGWSGGYGKRIVIDHGWLAGADLASTYNHLSRIVVSSGSVRRGELIAYSGTTGLSTGCHLHFEVLANGVYTNPMRFL